MPAPTHTPIDLATDALAILQSIPDTTSADRYPDLYTPGVQATVEERLSQIIYELNRASRFIRSIKPAEIETLIGGVNDEINGFRVFRGADQPATQTAKFGDIWLSPGDAGVRVPRVFNGVGFVEDLYAVEAILMPIIARLQALESEQVEVFQDAIDTLKEEISGTATTAGDTLGKLEALISSLTSTKAALASPAFTGTPTAPTAAPGTNTTQIATTAFAKAAADAAAAASVPLSQKGAANGVASLDSGGKVPAGQLPSYVDDVIEAANLAALPGTGETGKIYVTVDNGKVYRWSGSAYVEIVASPGSTDAVPEGAANKYFTDARAQAALATQLAGKLAATDVLDQDAFTDDSASKPPSQQSVAAYIKARLSSRRAHFTDMNGMDKTGANDNASALDALIAQAASAGVPIDAPAGLYATGRSIVIPKGTCIEGLGMPEQTINSAQLDPTRTTTFLIGHAGLGFHLEGAVGTRVLKGFAIKRQQPSWTGGSYTPNESLDWDILVDGAGGFVIDQLLHANTTKAIRIQGSAGQHNGRGLVQNCFISAFRRGIESEHWYDTLRCNNVQAWPFVLGDHAGSAGDALRNYMQANLIAYRLGRCDNPKFFSCFSIWAKIGFNFFQSAEATGLVGGPTYNGNFIACENDTGLTGIEVDDACNGHESRWVAYTTQQGLEVNSLKQPNVRVGGSNNKLWMSQPRLENAGAYALLVGGTGNRVITDNLFANGYDRVNEGWSAVTATSGNTLILNGDNVASPHGSGPLSSGPGTIIRGANQELLTSSTPRFAGMSLGDGSERALQQGDANLSSGQTITFGSFGGAILLHNRSDGHLMLVLASGGGINIVSERGTAKGAFSFTGGNYVYTHTHGTPQSYSWIAFKTRNAA